MHCFATRLMLTYDITVLDNGSIHISFRYLFFLNNKHVDNPSTHLKVLDEAIPVSNLNVNFHLSLLVVIFVVC